MLDAALGYARLGLPVFPLWMALPSITGGGFICGCGRYPCKDAGKHATIDEDLIRHWWTSAPNANVGIATSSRHLVLDVDPERGGDQTLAKLEREHGPLPSTWRAANGGGRSPLYFTAE